MAASGEFRGVCRALVRLGTLALLGLSALGLGAASGSLGSGGGASVLFSPVEREAILRHGPWPPAAFPPADPGNPLSGQARAIELGQRLFFDTALSASGDVSCASCHVPGLQFADGRARSSPAMTRHTPSLWNAVHQRWQGWDGAADSLWSQAIRPLLDPRELASSPEHIRRRVVADAELSCRWQAAVGQPVEQMSADAVLVSAARALGAFTATLQSPRTPFDDFRDALAREDRRALQAYPAAAQRGLRLFVGEGHCALCHQGPLFTHGEFADIGLPFFVRPGVVDSGRHGGIEALLASRFNRLSPWAVQADTTPVRHLHPQHRNFGEFRVPSLRGVAQTAPYMHDGQLARLQDVIHHYSTVSDERLHADGERLLRALHLDDQQQADLLAFLQTLSAPAGAGWRPSRLGPCRPAR